MYSLITDLGYQKIHIFLDLTLIESSDSSRFVDQ